jgi:hypothetical protein
MFARLTKGVALLNLVIVLAAGILQTALAQNYKAIIASERRLGPFLSGTFR